MSGGMAFTHHYRDSRNKNNLSLKFIVDSPNDYARGMASERARFNCWMSCKRRRAVRGFFYRDLWKTVDKKEWAKNELGRCVEVLSRLQRGDNSIMTMAHVSTMRRKKIMSSELSNRLRSLMDDDNKDFPGDIKQRNQWVCTMPSMETHFSWNHWIW